MARLTKDQRERAGSAAATRRGQLDLTQRELADKAGVGVDRINTLENAREWPQVRTQARIEAYLDWQPGALIRIARGGDPAREDIHGLQQPAGATAAADELKALTDQIADDLRAGRLGDAERKMAEAQNLLDRWNAGLRRKGEGPAEVTERLRRHA